MMKITLYKKLLFLASGLGALILLVALISIYTYKVQNNRDNFRKAHTILLRSSQVRTDFSRKRDTMLVNEFHSLMNDFREIIDNYKFEKQTAKLIETQENYVSLFAEYTSLYKSRGLDENHGIEGRFRESVHDIEDIIKSLNNYELYVFMLQARRSEKDYIMRRNKDYIDKVKKAVAILNSRAQREISSPETLKKIHDLSGLYLENFLNMSKTFEKIDNMESKIINVEYNLNQIIRLIAGRKEAKADMIRSVQLFVGIISILIGIVLSLTLARSITMPVEKLRNAAISISSGNLDVKLNIKTGDEIEDLSESFNMMVENISKSNKTILEQNKRLEDNNSELERLASNLRESLENLALLGSIGKSITSVLDFDDVISKLYSHLRTVIDSSTFAIGLIGEDKEFINYKLVIDKSGMRSDIITDLKDMSRIDTLCVATGNEIILTNPAEDFANLRKSYPELTSDEMKTITPNSRSAIYLPITFDNTTVGVISIESRNKDAYSKNIIDWLRNIASYLAIAIVNSQSYEEIKRSHEELKNTQKQLIQAEKMASLGQLTTGIAHEIKNPLNFITNYSDGAAELLEEVIEDLSGSEPEAMKASLINLTKTLIEVKGHLGTIRRNGQRIDGIVKSMMEHARSGKGEKTIVDINHLVQDYCKLAYQGFRGQYKNFNANLNFTLSDKDLKAELNHQEISRVITNLVDNACYSAMKKSETVKNGYKPELYIRTEKFENIAEIVIEDNGKGIPGKILDKIMNPFFTTKPTGEGTGLGLSLSYDIIKNGHNGEMKFESEEGNYARCIIRLPAKN